ncbi:phosphate ABC transporter permease PstA [Aggregatilineales bacterium SYSU G02658]
MMEDKRKTYSYVLPKREEYEQKLAARHRIGEIASRFFFAANAFALLVLFLLALNVSNSAFGLVVYTYAVEPDSLSDRPLYELSEPELVNLLVEKVPNRLRVVMRDTLSQVENRLFTTAPLREVLRGRTFDPEIADLTVNDLTPEQIALLLSDNLSQTELAAVIERQIIQPNVTRSWQLFDSLLNREQIERDVAERFPNGDLAWRSWISWDFVVSSVSSNPTFAGLRTALLGTFWVLLVTVITALPIGVGAAIYLEEYANDSWINRTIQTNIRNLAGVPSIIYGMLGLAVFVRVFEEFTSGRFLGITDTNGRTVMSAGLTLALVILPVIIVNAQEALKAVPSSLREASYGMGATKWQTVSRVVMPNAIGGIMTGLILSMSRAIGETAPLIVVGASTFIGIDPNGIFSKFTVVPIQIYQWTGRPELEFKNAAAGAILVLLITLLLMNSIAIYIRQRASVRL